MGDEKFHAVYVSRNVTGALVATNHHRFDFVEQRLHSLAAIHQPRRPDEHREIRFDETPGSTATRITRIVRQFQPQFVARQPTALVGQQRIEDDKARLDLRGPYAAPRGRMRLDARPNRAGETSPAHESRVTGIAVGDERQGRFSSCDMTGCSSRIRPPLADGRVPARRRPLFRTKITNPRETGVFLLA